MSSVVCRARLASFARAASAPWLIVRLMLPDGTAQRQTMGHSQLQLQGTEQDASGHGVTDPRWWRLRMSIAQSAVLYKKNPVLVWDCYFGSEDEQQ